MIVTFKFGAFLSLEGTDAVKELRPSSTLLVVQSVACDTDVAKAKVKRIFCSLQHPVLSVST